MPGQAGGRAGSCQAPELWGAPGHGLVLPLTALVRPPPRSQGSAALSKLATFCIFSEGSQGARRALGPGSRSPLQPGRPSSPLPAQRLLEREGPTCPETLAPEDLQNTPGSLRPSQGEALRETLGGGEGTCGDFLEEAVRRVASHHQPTPLPAHPPGLCLDRGWVTAVRPSSGSPQQLSPEGRIKTLRPV